MVLLRIALLFSLLAWRVEAAVIVATNGDYFTVSNAVNAAGFNGTVWVPTNSYPFPAGSNQWTGGLNLIGVSLMASNPISFLFTTNSSFGFYLSAGGSVTILSNLNLYSDQVNGPTHGVIGIDGSNVCFRLTHINFATPAAASQPGITISSAGNSSKTSGPWGLVDNCQFYWPGLVAYNYLSTFANGAQYQWGWSNTMTWGTTNCICIENCAFSKPGFTGTAAACEGQGGARITFRYNNLTNVVESTHGINSGSDSSTLQMEFYENNIQLPDESQEVTYIVLQRGGTSLIWSNSAAYYGGYDYINSIIQYWNECAQSDWASEPGCTSQIPTNDYPSPEQIGQGVIAPNQIGLVPCYVWSNNFPGSVYGIALGANADAYFIKQGRDVYTNSVMPGYVPLAYPYPFSSVPPSPPNTQTTYTGILTH